MKPHIPQDVERLMWIVAESSDPSAIADFESRFPEFAAELTKRRRMVSDLKGAKIPHTMEARIPAFRLRDESLAPNRGMWIVGGLAFGALAMATYSAIKISTYQPPVLPKVEPVKTEVINNPPTTVYSPPVRSETPTEPTEPTQSTVPDPAPTIQGEQVKTLKLSNTSLIAALKMIGDLAGYRVDIAPGFEDQQVSVDYQATTTEMLKDLGMRYGFTAFDQGDGSIIIVPAVDGGNPISDGGSPSRRIGG